METKSMSEMKKIYRSLAKKYGVSVEEVKRDMQEAINAAYVKPTFHAQCVPSKGAVPTVEEFLKYSANRVSVLCDLEKKD